MGIASNRNFTKGFYNACNKGTEFMHGVIMSNKAIQKTVVEEFECVRRSRGLSQTAAINEIKANGGFVSQQNLSKFRQGIFDTCSTTYLNILARWSGYTDFIELVLEVRRREKAEI